MLQRYVVGSPAQQQTVCYLLPSLPLLSSFGLDLYARYATKTTPLQFKRGQQGRELRLEIEYTPAVAPLGQSRGLYNLLLYKNTIKVMSNTKE